MEEKIYCDYCGEVVEEDYEVEGTRGTYCCEECRSAEESEYVCENCGIWEDTTQWDYDLNMRVCDYCYHEHTSECSNCGRRFWDDDGEYEDDEIFCCYECACEYYGEDRSDYIYNYSYKPCPTFYQCDDEEESPETRYYGLEIELDSDEHNVGLEDLYDSVGSQAYLKEDGSLSNAGVEIVTHPMTYEYHKKVMDYKNMFRIAEKEGLYAADSCGFHIHVNVSSFNDVERTKANLIRFFNHFWEEMLEISGRGAYEVERWAKKPGGGCDVLCTDAFIVNTTYNNGRYQAVNLQNSDTVEIRLFAGTDTYSDLMNKLTIVKNIIEVCDTYEWKDIVNMKFEDIINIEETKQVA